MLGSIFLQRRDAPVEQVHLEAELVPLKFKMTCMKAYNRQIYYPIADIV